MKPLLLMATCLFFSLGAAKGAPERFYLGTFTTKTTSEGIYTGTFDSATGKLGALTLAVAAHDPNFLAPSRDGKFLYAAEGLDYPGFVTAYGIAPDASLKLLNRQPSGGLAVCHVSLDGPNRNVFVANYSSGDVASFPVAADGTVGPAASTIQFQGSGPNQGRQHGPHAHSIYASPDNQFVYACDLGTDHIWIFKLDAATGKLTAAAPAFGSVPPGSGPRHLVFAQGGKIVYVVNEMGASVTSFTRDAATGALTPVETVSCLPESVKPDPKITAAEIALHPTGQWLYVSIRGTDLMAVFSVDEAGKLKLLQNTSPEVKQTRQFEIDPSGQWLITAGQTDGKLAVLKIDPATGKLSATGETVSIGEPVCVEFEGL